MNNFRTRFREKFGVTFTADNPEEQKLADTMQEIYLSGFEEFFATTLQALIGEIEGMKKVHKEFECNGAFGGKGCYESWCEDQNCRNAPKEHNAALNSAITILSKEIE